MNIEQIALEVDNEMASEGMVAALCPEEFLRRCLAKIGEGLEPVAWILDGELYEVQQHNIKDDSVIEGQQPLYATPHEAIIAGLKEKS